MPAGKPKPPTRTAEQKRRHAEVLARMQKDMDGFVDQYDAILRKREAAYADQITPTWRTIRDNLKRAIQDLYDNFADENGQLDATRLHEAERLRFLVEHVRETLRELRGQDDQLTNNLAYTYADSTIFHAWGLEQATKLAIVTPSLTHSHVMGILANPWLPDGATYSDRLRANTAYLAAKMKDTVTEAVGQGWDVQRAARRIQEVAGEGYHNGVRLARTEINRVASQASSHVFMQNADILDGKKWRATLDAVTAPKDADNDGNIYDLAYDTPEMPGTAGQRIPNHTNCRCKYSPVVSGVSDKVRERIARGEGDTASNFGERTYTKAADYREYAKERGLPDLDEALAKENPKKYLRRGEDMSAYSGGGAERAAATAAATAGQATKTAAAATPPADPFAAAVQERIAQGIGSEADMREVGKLVDEELAKALPADIQKWQDDYIKNLNARREATKQLNKWNRTGIRGRDYTAEQYNALYAEYEQYRKNELQALLMLQNGRATPLKNTLARLRPMGPPQGGIDWGPATLNGAHEAQQHLDYVSDYLPTQWLERSNAAGKMRAGLDSDNRGFYQQYKKYITIPKAGDDLVKQKVAWHELGHRFEDTITGIRDLEEEFYLRRTKGEPLKWMGAGYKKNERSRKDNFLELYMGKDYSPTGDGRGADFYELLSMGIEGLYSGAYDMDADKDFKHFILGVMTSL